MHALIASFNNYYINDDDDDYDDGVNNNNNSRYNEVGYCRSRSVYFTSVAVEKYSSR